MKKNILIIILLAIVLVKCLPNNGFFVDQPYQFKIPKGFPEPKIPDDNPMMQEKIALGKTLFFDPILSLDSTISCGSCHLQNLAFSDGKKISDGFQGRKGFRNVPGLFNLAYHENFFKDGGVPSLEVQILAPIPDPVEMNLYLDKAIKRLQNSEKYKAWFQKVFKDEPSAFGLTRSIAAFERTLISGNSPYDKYKFQNQKNALSSSQIMGLELFNSEKLKCNQCHSGFNFTNNSFENNGLYENYIDTGRARITNLPEDVGKFKVPSLRFVALTAPYMHDGSLPDLESVINHYASGGNSHKNKSHLIQGFEISEEEKLDLIHFLESLTDEEFLKNDAFKPKIAR